METDIGNIQQAGAIQKVSPEANPYKEMAPEARSVLRRLMYNSRNEKIRKETAMDILDRAGEAGMKPENFQRPIIIKDSQVVLLLKAAQEALSE